MKHDGHALTIPAGDFLTCDSLLKDCERQSAIVAPRQDLPVDNDSSDDRQKCLHDVGKRLRYVLHTASEDCYAAIFGMNLGPEAIIFILDPPCARIVESSSTSSGLASMKSIG